jgi:cell filamentation protein
VYSTAKDPYCYPDSTVLKNKADARTSDGLEHHEAMMTARRFLQPVPAGRFDVVHYRSIHRHIFQDVYEWAGEFRSVRISKGRSMFCYPEHIAPEMDRLFRRISALLGAERIAFAEQSVSSLADLNAIHPFREGNGRTQLTFLGAITAKAGHYVDFAKIRPDLFLRAMIASFGGDEGPLREELLNLL